MACVTRGQTALTADVLCCAAAGKGGGQPADSCPGKCFHSDKSQRKLASKEKWVHGVGGSDLFSFYGWPVVRQWIVVEARTRAKTLTSDRRQRRGKGRGWCPVS